MNALSPPLTSASQIVSRFAQIEGWTKFESVGKGRPTTLSHYEAKDDEATAAALACLESRCGLTKSVDDAYDAFDKKEPWDEVLS